VVKTEIWLIQFMSSGLSGSDEGYVWWRVSRKDWRLKVRRFILVVARAVVMCVMTVVVYVWRRRVSRGGREGGESDWGDWLCWLRSVVRRPE